MRYNQLGNTGMFVSEICLGTMTFGTAGENAQWGAIASLGQDGADADRQTRARRRGQFLRHGRCLFVRTGRAHPRPVAAQSRRQAPGCRHRHQGPRRDGRRPEPARLLARPHHGCGRCQPRAPADRPHRPLPASRHRYGNADRRDARALDDLVSSGKVRYVGVSNWQAWRIAKALGISDKNGLARFATVQAYYSIAGRDLERELAPLLDQEKLGLMVWSPLAGGLLSGKYGPGAPGHRRGPPRHLQLPAGERRPRLGRGRTDARNRREARHQRRNRRARLCAGQAFRDEHHHRRDPHGPARAGSRCRPSCKLDEDDLARLDAASALPAEYPGWMVERQGMGRRPAPFTPQ